MDRFEFFFTVYSLLLGFAIAELMLGYANLLRSPARPAWGVLTPALGVLIFIEIMITFLDAWLKLQRIELNLVGLLAPTMIAMAFFVAAVMAVPRGALEWKTLDDYFHDRKKWILGLLVGQLLITVFIIELPIMLRTPGGIAGWSTPQHEWVIANIVIVVLHFIPLFSRKLLVNLLPLLGLLAIFFYYYGNFTAPTMMPADQVRAPAPAAASETPPR